jgi:serine/threonine protein kinase
MELDNNSEHYLASRRDYGIIHDPIKVHKSSWNDFCEYVHQNPNNRNEPKKNPVYIEDARQSLKEYFSGAQAKLCEDSKHWVESQLMEECLHPLYYSTHYVMEDISNGLRNCNSQDRNETDACIDFCKIAFTTREDAPQRVAFAIRKNCLDEPRNFHWHYPVTYPNKSDSPVLSGHDAPSWRFNPLNIVAFLDIQKLSENLDTHVIQLCDYCESVLRSTPTREYCFCAITNIKKLMFVAVKKSENSFKWFQSRVFQDEMTVENLAAFLVTTPASLGCVEFDFPHSVMSLKRPLGCGSTSWVAEGKLLATGIVEGTSLSRAVKISWSKESLLVERKILSYLNQNISEEFKCMIPQIDDRTWQELNPNIRDYFNVLMTVYEKKTDESLKKRLNQLWKLLREVHTLGVVHCDIRTPNLRWNSERDCLVLLDWSSSRTYFEIGDLMDLPLQEATMITASSDVLTRMTTDSRNFKCYPKDEGVALIYCALQWCLPTEKELNIAVASTQLVKIQRDNFWESVHSFEDNEVIRLGREMRNILVEIAELQDNYPSNHLDDLVEKGIDHAYEFADKFKSLSLVL